MARTVTRVRKLSKAETGGGNRAPKPELTLEQAREQFELGTEERLTAELKALSDCKSEAKKLTNLTNKHKTQAGKAFIAYMLTRDLEPGKAEMHISDTAYSYDYATSESVSPERLFELYETKKITRDQFIKSISVPKEQAKRNIGDHVLMTIIDDKQGKTLDVRTRELDFPVTEPKVIVNTPKPKSPGKLKRVNEQKPGAAVKNPVKRIRRVRVLNR